MSGYGFTLAIAAASGLTVGLVLTILRNKLLIQLRRARKHIEKLLRESFPSTELYVWDGVYVHPVIWIAVNSDAERDQLRQEQDRKEQFGAALLDAGYPQLDLPMVLFESQETVTRDYGGTGANGDTFWLREQRE